MANSLAAQAVLKRLRVERENLLDLSLRNPLLNLRDSKRVGLQFVGEAPEALYELLVKSGKKMSFVAKSESEELPEQFNKEDKRLLDSKLQTPYELEELTKRLLYTYTGARDHMEERGVNVLFLALGALRWFEAPASELVRRAPLILVPVELIRSDARERFCLVYTGGDISTNLSLEVKLKRDFGIELPAQEDFSDFSWASYMHELETRISREVRWELEEKACSVGLFSFSKFLLFKDLAIEEWPEASRTLSHPILRSLFTGEEQEGASHAATHSRSGSELPGADLPLDEFVDIPETLHVTEADGTQLEALQAVLSGRNLVIQGPPGTGKSQTITNLLADMIGRGKRVLFVAEKLAALEVVKRRMDQLGLGDAFLELHSDKANKHAVIRELKRTHGLGQPRVDRLPELDILPELRRKLQQHAMQMHTEIGASGLTPYQVFGKVIRCQSAPALTNAAMSAGLERLTSQEFYVLYGLTQEFASLSEQLGCPREHIWWEIDRAYLSPLEEQRARQIFAELISTHEQWEQLLVRQGQVLGLPVAAHDRRTVSQQQSLARVLMARPTDAIRLTDPAWKEVGRLRALLQRGRELERLRLEHGQKYQAERLSANCAQLRRVLKDQERNWLRWLNPEFRDTVSAIRKLCVRPPTGGYRGLLAVLLDIEEEKRAAKALESEGQALATALGAVWQGADTLWDLVDQVLLWVEELQALEAAERVPTGAWGLAVAAPAAETLESLDQQLRAIEARHFELTEECSRLLPVKTPGLIQRLGEVEPQEYRARLLRQQEKLGQLQSVMKVHELGARLRQHGLSPLVDLLEAGQVEGTNAVLALERSWYESLLELAFRTHRGLAEFLGNSHADVVRQFRDLELKKLQVSRAKVSLSHWQQRPDGQVAGGQAGVLRKEFEKKTRFLPIRRLMERAGSAIQALKPVFMMSPLSVAAYLPPGKLNFDLVVFDEASQVKPVEALGALLRAPQAVVVGDSRQLPPTSFFDKQMSGQEEETEEDQMGDLESILSVLVASGTTEKMLRWHYRSRHESLIAVSNREFYDNRLVIFPSPEAGRVAEGLIYHHLPAAIYDSGRSRANRIEAEAVAKAVMVHAQKWPRLSLGVAAFSVAQRNAILDEVELQRRNHPELEHFFQAHPFEPFFVKNLENVQGDERDVIFISIGYGRDETGKIAMRFGPINNRGGERRLNVLMTRARRRCEVFTNLGADDIRLSSTSSEGVRALKQFLHYAETRTIRHEDRSRGEAESEFEVQVAQALRNAGHEVEQQIGVAGYFIDMAIVDPQSTGRYQLGIECDGASYHSALTVRDRDRLRQQVLESLGWKIHRIWSTDWFRDPQSELQRVEQSLASARQDQPQDRGLAPQNQEVVREVSSESASGPTIPAYNESRWELNLNGFGIAAVDLEWLAGVVVRIVQEEGPIHRDEVIRRIVQGAKTRTGTQIRRRIEASIAVALRHSGELTRRDEFLWPVPEPESVLRNRSHLKPAQKKLVYVPPEELREAVLLVVQSSFGMQPEEVPIRVLSMLGLPNQAENRNGVTAAVTGMYSEGLLQRTGGHLQVVR